MRYLKQYGLERSGTNYIAAVIESCFEQVKVLVNVLGWKHGDPGDPEWDSSLWHRKGTKGTVSVPKEPLVSNEEFVQIRAAHESGRLGYILCVKDPYSWIKSINQFRIKFGKSGGVQKVSDIAEEVVRNDCLVWAIMANKYLNFSRISLSFIANYEKAIFSGHEFIRDLCKKLTLSVKSEQALSFSRCFAYGGDNHKFSFSKSEFNPELYTHDAVSDFIGRRVCGIIDELIPQNLMDSIGCDITEGVKK